MHSAGVSCISNLTLSFPSLVIFKFNRFSSLSFDPIKEINNHISKSLILISIFTYFKQVESIVNSQLPFISILILMFLLRTDSDLFDLPIDLWICLFVGLCLCASFEGLLLRKCVVFYGKTIDRILSLFSLSDIWILPKKFLHFSITWFFKGIFAFLKKIFHF